MVTCRKHDEAFEEEEENGRVLRQRHVEAPSVHVLSCPDPPMLLDLNDDVLLNLMSFLTASDMNILETCCQRFRDIRSHESLDQTRVGTIVIKRRTSPHRLASMLHGLRARAVFTGNRTDLLIVGMEHVSQHNWNMYFGSFGQTITGVTKLEIAKPVGDARNEMECSALMRSRNTNCFTTLTNVLPNVTEIVLAGGVKLDMSIMYFHENMCPNLEKLTWHDCESSISVSGISLGHLDGLTALFLDGFHVKSRLHPYCSEDVAASSFYMFCKCRHLERLSIKRASWTGKGMSSPQPLPHEMLLKMVRCHPTLQWLRSDLSDANILTLKQERPDMVFVSD